MSFPFLQVPQPYIKKELLSRLNPVSNSKLVPWIKVTSNLNDGAYPNGYTLSSNTYSDTFGTSGYYQNNADKGYANFKPNPIVTGFTLDFSSRGVTKTGTIKFQCFTVQQLETLQKFFLEPGVTVFVQWGWNKSASTGVSVIPEDTSIGTQKKYYRDSKSLNAIRKKYEGCYDNLLGVIINGKSSISDESFTLECKLCTIGEVMMGLTSGDPAGEQNDVRDGNANPEMTKGKPYFGSSIGKFRKAESRHLCHWMYFYNSLPDALKVLPGLKSWGETAGEIDPRVDFINYDEWAIEDAKDETDGGPTDDFTFLGKDFEGEDSKSPIFDQKFIRFSAFIAILNKIINIKKQLPTPNEKNKNIFGVNITNSYCGAFRQIFSIAPTCFIPNENCYNWFNENPFFLEFEPTGKSPTAPEEMDNSVKGVLGGKVSFPIQTLPSVTVDGNTYFYDKPYSVGWIGDLYVNHDLAIQCLQSTLNSPIKDSLDSLLNEMQKATDNLWDFQVIVDPTTDDCDSETVLTIADANLICVPKEQGGGKAETFDLYGTNCVFKDFNFEFDIPKGLGNKLYMEKATQGYDGKSVETGVGLFSSAGDRLTKDSIEKTQSAPSSNNTTQAKGSSADERKLDAIELWTGFVDSTKLLLQPSLSEKYNTTANSEGASAFNVEWSDFLIPGISTNKDAFDSKRRGGLNQALPSPNKLSSGAPINVTVTFTVLGISGFVVGDLIKINNLPAPYIKEDKGAFMVLKISHEVDKTFWVTKVEAMFRPYT